MATNKAKSGLTKAQSDALRRRKTSFGVLFQRRKAITKIKDRSGKRVAARAAGEFVVTSPRLFSTSAEANHHGKRFARIEGHKAYWVTFVEKAPNAWVNFKTGKTNPLIGRARTNRR